MELYSMGWRDINLQHYTVTAASYGGPIGKHLLTTLFSTKLTFCDCKKRMVLSCV